MQQHRRRFTLRHGLRRLYRWRRAAGLSVIALIAWLIRARRADRPSMPMPMDGVRRVRPAAQAIGR
jgi:hypothetical protein